MVTEGMPRALRAGVGATLLSGCAMVLATQSVHAQQAEAEPEGLAAQAIIVTAERRATDLQDTPLSILAITNETIQAKGIEDLEDLAAFSPNLSITPSRGGGNNTANFVIRGVGGGGGATGERGVGLYVDGIYMPRTSGAVLSVIDVDRVEVLRGPQGTLFGRNSTGGAIRIFSRQPSDNFEGYVRGTLGNQDRADISGTVNLPVTEGVAVRAQAAYLSKGGFVERGTEMLGEESDFVGRVQARFEPSNRFEATVGFLYNKSRANGTPLVFEEFDMRPGIEGVLQGNYADWINDAFKAAGQAPLAPYNDPRIVRGPYQATDICLIDDFNPDYDPACNQTLRNRFVQADLKMVYDLNDDISFTSISGYSNLRFRGISDYQVLGTEARSENVDSEVFYQELQANMALFNGAVDLVAGASYFHEESAAPNITLTRRGTSVYPSNPGNPPNADGGLFRLTDTNVRQTAESWGLFLSATWHVTDRLNLTGGLRQAFDSKDYRQTRRPANDFTPAPGTTSTSVQADDTFKALDWRGTIDYKIADDVMAYATISKAYKAGSYSYTIASWTPANGATGEAQSANVVPVPNEKVINYEAGLRMTFFDRLRLNPTVFMMDFTNRQAGVQVVCGSAALPNVPAGSAQCPVGFVIQVQNQGDVKLKGVELDGQFLVTPDLSIDGGFAMTDPTLKNAPGNTVNLFPDVPSPTWNIGATFSPDTSIGRLTMNVNYARVGPQETHPSSGTDSSYTLPAYGLMNARVQLRMEDMPVTLSLFANNLLDNVYATYAQRFGGGYWDSPSGTGLAAPMRSALSVVRGRPREVGLTVQVDF